MIKVYVGMAIASFLGYASRNVVGEGDAGWLLGLLSVVLAYLSGLMHQGVGQ